MKKEYEEIIRDYEQRLKCGQDQASLVRFFELLFESKEIIQFKQTKRVHPADALYVDCGSMQDFLDSIMGQYSLDGISFCCNAVPQAFLEKMDEIEQYERVCKYPFDKIAEDLRESLSLTCDLFSHPRTFFIEADTGPDGNEISSIEDRKIALTALLETGIPMSFVIDTGGRGCHMGIALEESVPLSEFNEMVKLTLSRLPTWLDTAVGRANQLGRVPGTLRTNKKGERAAVTLVYSGNRISKATFDEWIKSQPVLNPEILERTYVDFNGDKLEDADIADGTDKEDAAWRFIAENNLDHSRSVKNNKIQVSCPNAANHKNGRDKNMSAFINVEAGFVWCSACQETVGRTFKKKSGFNSELSQIISKLHYKSEVGKLGLKKLF